MTEITLVLPFTLPVPELAPDLLRELQAPALAALLTRTTSHRIEQADPDARALPHEMWLGLALGLVPKGRPAPAAAAMHGLRLAPAAGTWFIINPAHVEIARNHLLMSDMRRLALSEAHSRALFESAKPYCDESGNTLLYGDAHTWFMRADHWAALDTATPDVATGMNLTDWLPTGAQAREFRKLQNELQMLWFQHPANVEREAAGQLPINSFWPWGAADVHRLAAPDVMLACADAPPWLSAFATWPCATVEQVCGALAQDSVFYCGAAVETALAGDWGGWLQQMRQLEAQVFAPILAALEQGQIDQVRLILDRRDVLIETSTTKMAQRKFWRRPKLDRLLA
jgi:hypothetical protein